MKKYVNEKFKVFLIIFITSAICISGTVYATYSYLASDIEYVPSNKTFNVNNVSEALDYLYQKDLKSQTFKLRSVAYNTTDSTSQYFFTGLDYKYFKIINLNTDANIKKCQIRSVETATKTNVDLQVDKEYLISDYSSGFWINFASNSTAKAICSYDLYLYN